MRSFVSFFFTANRFLFLEHSQTWWGFFAKKVKQLKVILDSG